MEIYTVTPPSTSVPLYEQLALRDAIREYFCIAGWAKIKPSYRRKQLVIDAKWKSASWRHLFLRNNIIKGNVMHTCEYLTFRIFIRFIRENYSKYLSLITSPITLSIVFHSLSSLWASWLTRTSLVSSSMSTKRSWRQELQIFQEHIKHGAGNWTRQWRMFVECCPHAWDQRSSGDVE